MRRPRRTTTLLQLALCLGLWLGLVAPAPTVAAGRAPAHPAETVAAAEHAQSRVAARPASLAAQPAATSAPTLGPAVTGVLGLPDGARELPAQRTRTSRTYANPRGTLTTLVSTSSQHYQDASGAWQGIDNSLVADRTPGDAAVNRANRYQVHLPPVSPPGRSRSRWAASPSPSAWRGRAAARPPSPAAWPATRTPCPTSQWPPPPPATASRKP